METDEDSAFETEYHTEYGSTAELNSDYYSDDGEFIFDANFSPEAAIEAFPQNGEGTRPYEFFREQRRSARLVPSADGDNGAADGPSGMEIDDAEADLGKQVNDRRGTRRKAGHGRRARRRKPTRVSRGILPPQGDELMNKANTQFMLGKFQEARKHLLECIKRYPNFTEPWMSLAATFENMGLHDRALHSYAIALHMKPSDDNIAKHCAEMSMMHGYHKQAIWAWSKYIRMKRREYEPQQARLLLFVEHIHAQTNPRQVKRAIAFLEEFAEEHPSSFIAEHVNMLAELHMHRKSYHAALNVLQDLYTLERCRESPDLAAKVSICSLHTGEVHTAVSFAKALWELIPEETGTGHVTYDRSDLFLDVAKAMNETDTISSAAEMLGKFLDEHKLLIPESLEQGMEGEAEEDIQENKPVVQSLHANFLDMLPYMSACSIATDIPLNKSSVIQVMLNYVDILLMTQSDASKALAGEINAEIQQILTSDSAAVRDIETQVKVIENWYQAGNDAEVEKCVARLLDTQAQLEQEESQAKERALSDLSLELQRRVVMLQRNPHLAARARQSVVRDAAAAAESAAEFVPSNPELFWSNSPAPGASGAGAGPSSQAPAVEDEQHILALQPGLAHRDIPAVKDRRQGHTRELDKQAIKIMEERAEELELAGSMRKSGSRRLKHLAEHPCLFPILIPVLEARLDRGDTEWVSKHAAGLLGGARMSTGSQQLRCNRTRLMLLIIRCRLEAFSEQGMSPTEQKHVLSAWPHSVQVWNLFTRWCHQRNHIPIKHLNRTYEAFKDSLPLIMLRGHASLIAGQTAMALKTYFEAFSMVPENSTVNLCIGAAYLAYAACRSVGDRHAAVLKAFAFLTRYAVRAGSRAEAAYNMGRAFHQLDLLHLAVEWYNRSLSLTVADRRYRESLHSGDDDAPDVSFECAHNLALIYEGSGAIALAARVRAAYCTV